MKIEYIFLIIVVFVWLSALLITGLLAIQYGKKHKPFMEVRDQYHKEWEEQKQNINIEELLKPIKIKMQLPKDEKVYFLEDEVFTYIIDRKTRDYKFFARTNDTKLDAYESYFDDPDFITLKSTYKLKDENKKGADYNGMLYVTNKRLMFQNKDEYIQISLSKIIKSYVTVIRVQSDYLRGYVIHTEDSIYQVVSDNPQVSLIINELKRFEIYKQQEKQGE